MDSLTLLICSIIVIIAIVLYVYYLHQRNSQPSLTEAENALLNSTDEEWMQGRNLPRFLLDNEQKTVKQRLGWEQEQIAQAKIQYHVDNHANITTAILYIGEVMYIGVSWKHPDDPLRPEIGRHNALKRVDRSRALFNPYLEGL